MRALQQHRLLILALLFLSAVPFSTAQAQVEVTSADPASALQGTISLDVTVAGNGFDSTANVKFLVTGTTDPGGITVKSVKVRGSRKLIATIDIAETAVVDKFDIVVELSDGRKGKGTSLFTVQKKGNGDPCLLPGLDFPAFTYWKSSGNGQAIYVADSTGVCSRMITTVKGAAGGATFAYPVDAEKGRLVWADAGIVGVDFTIDSTTNDINVGNVVRYSDIPTGTFTLSRDGQTLYLATDCRTLARLSLDGSGVMTPILSIEGLKCLSNLSVNGDESLLFADLSDSSATVTYSLVRIPLTPPGSYEVVAQNPSGTSYEFTPAADPSSNLIAYREWLLTDGTYCDLLVIKDGTTGIELSYGQPAHGLKPTWLNGMVLADGRALARRRDDSCRYTGTIMQLDPISGEQVLLLDGYDPDGK